MYQSILVCLPGIVGVLFFCLDCLYNCFLIKGAKDVQSYLEIKHDKSNLLTSFVLVTLGLLMFVYSLFLPSNMYKAISLICFVIVQIVVKIVTSRYTKYLENKIFKQDLFVKVMDTLKKANKEGNDNAKIALKHFKDKDADYMMFVLQKINISHLVVKCDNTIDNQEELICKLGNYFNSCELLD